MNCLKIVLKTRFVLIFIALCFLIPMQGCMNYYKVKKVSNVTAQEMKNFIAKKRFIVVHQNSLARYLSKADFADNLLTGELFDLRADQMKFKSTKPKGATRYRNTFSHNESYVTNEVHLYLKNSVVQDFGTAQKVTIPLQEIDRTDVYQKDEDRTVFSWVAPVVFGAGAVLGATHLLLDTFVKDLSTGPETSR